MEEEYDGYMETKKKIKKSTPFPFPNTHHPKDYLRHIKVI